MNAYTVPPAEAIYDGTDGHMPTPASQTSRWWSNGKRKTIILTAAASAAIVGLGATNVIGALNASAADAAHHRQIVALNKTHAREIQQIKAQDAATLHNALFAQKATDAKIAKAQAASAYASGKTNGYSSGYGAGNNAGYSSGYGAGNSAGYSSGYGAGNSAGYSNGYSNGSLDGYNNGYSNGYSNGASTPTYPYGY
jgi:hypothetical protein